jgi:hypothetical protein
MKNKRLFEILDEMNQDDIKNGTGLVEVGGNFISADKVKGGAKISMGMPESSIYDLMHDKKMAILVLIDKKEYKLRTENNHGELKKTNGLNPTHMIIDDQLPDCTQKEPTYSDDLLWILQSCEGISSKIGESTNIILTFEIKNQPQSIFEIRTSEYKILQSDLSFEIYNKKFKYSELIELRKKLKV